MKDLIEVRNEILQKRKKVEVHLKKVEDNKKSIKLKLKSINLEKVLNSFPSRGIGSIISYNKLNEKYDVYDTFQFNKIIRYVVFIENLENEYFNLVKNSKNEYISNPDSKLFEKLINKYNFLSLNYQLLKILTDEVEGDKLLFNKVFNELEDQGMFLSKVETFNMETFKSINNSLGSVVNLLGNVNDNITSLSVDVMTTNDYLSDINSTLWNLETKN
ncbi:MAG: hypothetical protein P8L72_05230 [Flavobacteriaceae bacterium]|nr:hypothetical protein [Flavobacteriaceae bacterium]